MSVISPSLNAGLLRRMTLNAAALAVGGVVAQACLMLVEALVARKLGGSDYGVFSTVQAIALTSLHFFELGMGWKLIEDGSRDSRTIAPLLGTTCVLKFVFAVLVYVAMLFGLPLAGYSARVTSFFAIFFGYGFAFALQESLAGANAARHQMYINAIYQAATPAAVLAFVAIATGIFPSLTPTLTGVGWAYVLGGALVTGTWTWQSFRAERPTVDLARTADILRGSYLYGIGGFLYQASYRIEVMALSMMRGMADVGLFAAADKFTDIGVKVALLGSRVTAPLMFNQSRHDIDGYVRSCRMLIRASSVLGVAGGLVLATLARPLVLGIFGQSFRGSALILAVLAPSVALRFSTAALRLALTSSDQHARRVGGLATGVAVSALCNVALIPSFGTLGAAGARFAGDLAQIVLLLCARSLPISRRSLVSWMLLPLLLGALSFVAALVITDNPWARMLLSLLVFAAALTATKCVRLAELRELIRAARA